MIKRALSLSALLLVLSASAFAQTAAPAPALMNFQGRLAKPDGTPIADGTYSVTFSLYDALMGGAQKWTQAVSAVSIKNGSFAVLLTVDTPGLFNGNLWLEIKVGSDPALSPRQQIVSVAYAQKANTVPDGAITASKLADGAVTLNKLDASIAISGIPSGYSILGSSPVPPPGYTYFGITINTGNALDAWTTKSPLPALTTPGVVPVRAGASVVALNNLIYVMGGYNSPSYFKTLQSYNPLTDTWTTLADAPGILGNGANAAAAAGGKIYYPQGNSFYVYDPVANTWTTKTTNSDPVANFQMLNVVALNNKIYVIGGLYYNSGYVFAGALAVYDPANGTNGTWTSLPSMPTPRTNFASVAYGNKIYTFGGATYPQSYNSSNPPVYYNATQVYDLTTNTWSIQAGMPTARSNMAAAVINNKIYVTGGTKDVFSAPFYFTNTAALAANEEYDPAANTWAVKANLPTARFDLGAAALFNSAYAIGGRYYTSATGVVYPGANEQYTPLQVFYVHTKN